MIVGNVRFQAVSNRITTKHIAGDTYMRGGIPSYPNELTKVAGAETRRQKADDMFSAGVLNLFCGGVGGMCGYYL